MLRTDAGVIQTRRNRMRVLDLPVVVHQQISAIAVQHARPAAGYGSRMQLRQSVTRGLDAENFDAGIVEERMKQSHCVGPPTDASDQRIRQPAFGLLHLYAGLIADDRLE